MGWKHVVVEGFCFGKYQDKKYPCGSPYPTVLCLSNGKCPHFHYSASSEREASVFVPVRLILWDRLQSLWGNLKDNISWHLWDRWLFEKRWQETMSHSKVVECTEWDARTKEAADEFTEWFGIAKEG